LFVKIFCVEVSVVGLGSKINSHDYFWRIEMTIGFGCMKCAYFFQRIVMTILFWLVKIFPEEWSCWRESKHMFGGFHVGG